MERIIEQRVQEGYPGKAIQWGAIGDVGFVAEKTGGRDDIEIVGTLQQRISSCFASLDTLITNEEPIVASMVVAQKRFSSDGSALGLIMNIMGIKNIQSIPKNTTLSELGMDSLVMVEVKQILERELEIILSPDDLRTLTFVKLQQLCELKNKNLKSSTYNNEFNNFFGAKMNDFKLSWEDANLKNRIVYTLNTCNDINSKCKTILIPGIEGFVFGALHKLAANLSCDVHALNVHSLSKFSHLNTISACLYEVISFSKH